jgi:hypothetical protein
VPIKVGFWLKSENESPWYRYVALEDVNDATMSRVYDDVLKVAETIENPKLDRFEGKLLKADKPLPVGAWKERNRHTGRLETLCRKTEMGEVAIDEAILYLVGSADAGASR